VENATCTAGGIYVVEIDMNEITAYAESILTVVCKYQLVQNRYQQLNHYMKYLEQIKILHSTQ
jgi:GTP cyclohydrolase III